MSFGQWFRYVFRDPWDFADPEKVADWPEECRDSGSDRQAKTPQAAEGEASQSGGEAASPKEPGQ